MSQRGRPPGPERIPFPLRVEKETIDAVKRCAASDLRSVNAEIEVLLREALTHRGIRLKSGATET
ncbi:MAG: Arc family DNA-binding protein [Methanobacterium sp.]|nr:Arc family DNA-binding protein [Methanobacterium sp.]